MNVAADRHAWFQDSLQQVEQALYGPSKPQFPTNIELSGEQYKFAIWQGEQLPDRLLGYDTETAKIIGKEIPPLALATVYGDAGSGYFIHPHDLPRFIRQHSQAYWCCHNAAFDFWVTAQALQSESEALALWWDVAGGSRLLCTMLLDSLIRLARIDEEPINRDLGTVAADYCGLQLDKNDPYRLRYGELSGVPSSGWKDVEPGFWSYAGCDPVATLLVAQRQFQIAQQLIAPYCDELLPGALRRFGPLTVCLQVQGAIALDYITRTGVPLDLAQANKLQEAIGAEVERYRSELEQLDGQELFKRYGPRSQQAGQLQRTEAGVPKRNANAIKARLAQIAQVCDSPIRPPTLKDGSCTDAVRYWKQHRDLHPFIAAYVQFSEQAKLKQFFKQLKHERIYPRYRPLVRTGRTSCSDPNLQQLPRDARFRAMIKAPHGFWLLQIDYSVLELRTLAQICLRRFGKSVLADLFEQGIDPHCYTAALLMSKTLEEFSQLPLSEQKLARQRAKAINFGVPGGLGAASLVSYAKHSYGVQLTVDQAKDFRKMLITEVYPELQLYLKDDQHSDIAHNLQTTKSLVRHSLPRREQLQTAARIVSGCEATPHGDAYEPELIKHIWLLLQQLNKNPALQADLTAHRPHATLMRQIFFGTAATISGRLRGHVGFSQRANTPFQGLAADGNKLALFRLLRNGFQVCGFVHDEMLLLIPDGTNYDEAVFKVQQILAESMREFTPDVSSETSFLLADRWYKDIDQQPQNADGCIVPYSRHPETKREPPTVDMKAYKKRKPVYAPETIWSFTLPPDAFGSRYESHMKRLNGSID